MNSKRNRVLAGIVIFMMAGVVWEFRGAIADWKVVHCGGTQEEWEAHYARCPAHEWQEGWSCWMWLAPIQDGGGIMRKGAERVTWRCARCGKEVYTKPKGGKP